MVSTAVEGMVLQNKRLMLKTKATEGIHCSEHLDVRMVKGI
ncbi:hypothetical protein [Shouchella miscanthi]|uniref:Uncharacterized protein n=1 Tax=Shouchella miscanthi TaxID=2598861 RepID=A0ABU6NS03_9BACI|nr:hypothetical protein [Shouchella miscanthi]